MHIALETPKGNKIKCGFIDALLVPTKTSQSLFRFGSLHRKAGDTMSLHFQTPNRFKPNDSKTQQKQQIQISRNFSKMADIYDSGESKLSRNIRPVAEILFLATA
jgi:hypothetical protein